MKKQLIRFGLMAGFGAFVLANVNAKNVMSNSGNAADTIMSADTASFFKADTSSFARDTANFSTDTASFV